MAVGPQMFFERVDPSTGFDQLSAPVPGISVLAIGDAADALPGEASRAKLTTLRQRAQDARSIYLPISDEIREARLEKQRAEIRLKQLKLRRGEGGPELDEDDHQVIDIRSKLARLEATISRLAALEAARAETLRVVGAVPRACEDWLSRGRLGGTTLVEAPLIAPGDILKPNERLFDAVEQLRHRLREFDADAHRIRSSPFPSGDCKKRLREQVESLAARGTPHVGAMIEHNADIGWPTTPLSLSLGAAIVGETGHRLVGDATGDSVDTFALFAWMHRPALLRSLDGLIDSESDDAHALSASEREMRLADIARDRLMIERQECSLVWHAQSQGESIEHRPEASVPAVRTVAR